MYNTTIILLSFEGPDPYSSVGGVGSRVIGLAEGLAGLGYETHLFFIGAPDLPATEVRHDGRLHLHRWCQWISAHHPKNAYDGEAWKAADLAESLPRWLAENLIEEKVGAGRNVVVLAEEWQTAKAVVGLRRLVEERGWSDRVYLLWNANSAHSLEEVPWDALRESAVITTVSRYMRTVLTRYGVEARVIPNGISDAWARPPSQAERWITTGVFGERVVLAKPGAWDRQGTETALSAVSIMKRMGVGPLLMVGGCGDQAGAVLAKAEAAALVTTQVELDGPGSGQMLEALRHCEGADVALLVTEPSLPQQQLLFNGAVAVLATSCEEPFGTIGLEAMACGGVAVVGCSGEDYATPGHDSISLQTMDPWEIVHNVAALQDSAVKAMALRRNARQTAARYTWNAVIQRCLLPALSMIGVPRIDVRTRPMPPMGPPPVGGLTWRKEGRALAGV